MKYHVITLGCQMNLSDSERVRTVLDGAGLEWTEDENEAELLGIIACSVRQKAIDKVYGRIHKWNLLKKKKPLISFISGCMLPNDKERFLKLFDIVFMMNELPNLPEMIAGYGMVSRMSVSLQQDGQSGQQQLWNIKPNYASTFEAYIPIQNGCDKFCTFCAVPYTRGREVSRPSAEIVAEVQKLIESGYKSITLLGQNVNSYGLDKRGEEISFAQLLDKIGQIGLNTEAEFLVYFTSPHPRDMGDDVLETIAKYRCLAKQIHLPMQSGDDRVLIKMNRKHSMDDYRRVVDSIRRILPTATLFTDIIIGFPGETDEQYQNTVEALKTFRFDMAYIAQYSPRPGAVSARWDDSIDHVTKKERFHHISNELKTVSAANNKLLEGQILRVLVTDYNPTNGYSAGYTEGRVLVRFKHNQIDHTGNFVWLKISSSIAFSIEGELVTNLLAEPHGA